MKKIVILFLVTRFAVSTAYAQVPDPDTTARHFIIMASIDNLQEINTGTQAAQKATRADIRSFGEMMVTDHSALEQKLLQLTKSKGYQIPAAATETPPPDLNLAKASGDDFNRIYIHDMVVGHRSTVMMFENYAITGNDSEVRAFAQQMLPTLKEHAAVINALDEKYKKLIAK